MNRISAMTAATAPPGRDDHRQLRRMTQQLEALFIQQLFQAMRASVPQGGAGEVSSGQELFTSLLDERIASMTAERMHSKLGEALYRQLSRRLPVVKPESSK